MARNQDRDIINEAIVRSSEVAFRANEALKRLMPNPIGQTPEQSRLSLSDIKGALSGIGCVILIFLVINFLGLISGLGSERFFPFTASSLGVIYSLLILALVMALLGLALTFLLSAIYTRIKRG